jgi:hypothetical protein
MLWRPNAFRTSESEPNASTPLFVRVAMPSCASTSPQGEIAFSERVIFIGYDDLVAARKAQISSRSLIASATGAIRLYGRVHGKLIVSPRAEGIDPGVAQPFARYRPLSPRPKVSVWGAVPTFNMRSSSARVATRVAMRRFTFDRRGGFSLEPPPLRVAQ